MSTDTREKIFVRLSTERAKLFRDTIKSQNSSLTQQDVLEQLVENYLAHAKEGSIRHLDGTVCPIAALISGLVTSVDQQWRMLQGFKLAVKTTPPPP